MAGFLISRLFSPAYLSVFVRFSAFCGIFFLNLVHIEDFCFSLLTFQIFVIKYGVVFMRTFHIYINKFRPHSGLEVSLWKFYSV